MTVEQVGINHAAIAAGALRLTATGWTGDAHAFVESLVRNAVLDGYRPLDRPVPLRGPSSTDEGREKAKRIYADMRAAARTSTARHDQEEAQ